MEYDVFISCKSEDYKFAEEIYDFLTSNGVNTFLASKELRNLGDSEYRRAISSAMKSAYHMIVFASKAEYIESPWVYYEWDMYVNAMLKGFKKGQILTILKDIVVEEINMDLWKYESFSYTDYKEKLLSYVETPSYIERREEAKRKRLEKERLEEEKLNLQRQKEQKDLEANIRISVSALNNSEDKVRINREQLLLQIASIDDEIIKQELYTLLDDSGPLHVENRTLKESISRSDELIVQLQAEVNENGLELDRLNADIKKLQQEFDECFSHKKDLEDECAELRQTLNDQVLAPNARAKEMYEAKLRKSKMVLHVLYCSIISILIGAFSILCCIEINDGKTKKADNSKLDLSTIYNRPNNNYNSAFDWPYKKD